MLTLNYCIHPHMHPYGCRVSRLRAHSRPQNAKTHTRASPQQYRVVHCLEHYKHARRKVYVVRLAVYLRCTWACSDVRTKPDRARGRLFAHRCRCECSVFWSCVSSWLWLVNSILTGRQRALFGRIVLHLIFHTVGVMLTCAWTMWDGLVSNFYNNRPHAFR